MICFGLTWWHIIYNNAKISSYMYIKYMIRKHKLLIRFLNDPDLLILLHFFLSNMNNSFNVLIICVQTVKYVQVQQFNTNYSVKHQSFVYTKINNKIILFQDRWMKGCILPFPTKKGDLGLAKNYRGMTLTSIETKIYNALLRNGIEPKIENILRKNQIASGEIDPQIFTILYVYISCY